MLFMIYSTLSETALDTQELRYRTPIMAHARPTHTTASNTHSWRSTTNLVGGNTLPKHWTRAERWPINLC